MDLSKLKKRPSYPFETIAVAVSFSSRCKFLLAEAKRICDACDSSLLLLHVGEKTSEKESNLDEMMDSVGINPKHCRIIWMEGEPVDTILRLCKLNIVDLLILGALEKENFLKFYIGSIARSISRKAKCSVLLLTSPNGVPQVFRKFVVNGVENPKTIHTINTSLYLAKKLRAKEIIIANELDLSGVAMTMADQSTAPESKEIIKGITEKSELNLQQVLEQCDTGNIKISDKILKGKQGYAISKYAKDKKVDLLIVNSPDTNLNLFDRIFAHDIEYVLADLPCNVLIVHSRV
jgi:nucleotide-binding universal stress UspA family protein